MESPLDLLSRAADLVDRKVCKELEEDQPLDFSCRRPPTPTLSVVPPKTEPKRPSVIKRSYSSSSSPPSSPQPPQKLVKRRRKKNNTKNNTQVSKSRRVVVITTSKEDDIEEHFRRSLGEGYCSEKKSSGSVDEHFAKALGSETWMKLKKD